MSQQKPRPDNDNGRLGVEVEIVEVRDAPGHWLVEAIDYGSEGEVYRAVFSGPMAEQRGRDYARLTYGAPLRATQSSTST